ncbi:hypothetical protein GQ44DRAFT_729638 [Phaeosphaeriaceae sp. PMI808]|nr:hypothetical protein GQ44DRAFT_729638 [Phaeosphaeriaceae sp. PMI808]
MIKLPGKFGRNLVVEYTVICGIFPALCPVGSALNRQLYGSNTSFIRVKGNDGDALWGMTLDESRYQDASNLLELATIAHEKPVTRIALNENCMKLATYGLKSTKIWLIPSGRSISVTPNPSNMKAMDLCFADKDRRLFVGGEDNTARHVYCVGFESGWVTLNPNLLQKNTRGGYVLDSPMCLKFNGGNNQIDISYRGAPLTVWRLSDGRCINRYRRASDSVADQLRLSMNWFGVDRFTWNPIFDHILRIYRDSCISKWHPVTNKNVETHCKPRWQTFRNEQYVVYQLASEDLVIDLIFSPDGCRFYHLRGGIAVTVFAPAHDGSSYCAGYEGGSVQLSIEESTNGVEIAHFHNFLNVIHVTWSSDSV